MNNSSRYLRENVVVEPLVNQWYAWPQIVSPATASMNVANSHIRIMRSFLSSPDIHAAAVINPALRGGPFLDIQGFRPADVRELLDKTLSRQLAQLQFAKAYRELSELLQREATGASLEGLYAKCPLELRGYIELVYDLEHRPSIRLLEGLLYRSHYYSTDHQSVRLYTANSDNRPFAFSTPRLMGSNSFHASIPFSSSRLDDVFKSRHNAICLATFKEWLGASDSEDPILESFLTNQPPRPFTPAAHDVLRIRYIGHACVLLEYNGVAILTDAFVPYAVGSTSARFSFCDLPDVIDYVLITHSHSDHVSLETLLQIRSRVREVIVPKGGTGALQDPSLRMMLRMIGFTRVRELEECEDVQLEDGTITGIPFLGEHGDLNITCKLGYLVQLGGHSILFLADSKNIENRLYDRIADMCGQVDLLFIGLECEGAPLSWIYGHLLTSPITRANDQSRRLAACNAQQANQIVEALKCKRVFVYAMGLEPWLKFIMGAEFEIDSPQMVESDKLVKACRERGVMADRLERSWELSLPRRDNRRA